MTEQWQPIDEIYEVSNCGRVRSLDRVTPDGRNVLGKILRCRLLKGYPIVTLCKNGLPKTHQVHRLVAAAFIPNPECKREVNHKDGDKENNDVNNLEWVTPKENGQHASVMGLLRPYDRNGCKNSNCRVTQSQAHCIFDVLQSKAKTVEQIAEEYGIGKSTVILIRQGRHWTIQNSSKYKAKSEKRRRNLNRGVSNPRCVLTESDVKSIRAEYEPRKITAASLAQKYGVSKGTICAIIYRRNWS